MTAPLSLTISPACRFCRAVFEKTEETEELALKRHRTGPCYKLDPSEIASVPEHLQKCHSGPGVPTVDAVYLYRSIPNPPGLFPTKQIRNHVHMSRALCSRFC